MANQPTAQQIVRAPTVPYPPAGYCIYCGSREEPLTLEHIFPLALEAIMSSQGFLRGMPSVRIHPIETLVMREMLRPYRVSIGLVGKHQIVRPKSLRINTWT